MTFENICNHKIKSDFVNSTSKTANKFFLFSRIRCISFCNILVTSFSKTKGTLVSKYTNTKSYPKFECCRKLLNELHWNISWLPCNLHLHLQRTVPLYNTKKHIVQWTNVVVSYQNICSIVKMLLLVSKWNLIQPRYIWNKE